MNHDWSTPFLSFEPKKFEVQEDVIQKNKWRVWNSSWSEKNYILLKKEQT